MRSTELILLERSIEDPLDHEPIPGKRPGGPAKSPYDKTLQNKNFERRNEKVDQWPSSVLSVSTFGREGY